MTTKNLDVARTVAEWALNRPAVARLFETYEIDLCRDGDKTVIQACREHKVVPAQLVEELMRAARPADCEIGSDWGHASIRELCDHIEAVHHLHLRRELPLLSVLLDKVANTYRAARPELEDLQRSFGRFRGALERHLQTEATVLLPALRALEEENRLPGDSSSAYLAGLIGRLEDDHSAVDEALREIRRLTNGYALPPSACATYGAMLDGFWELEWHLHKSVYEEDDILFPKAIRHQAAILRHYSEQFKRKERPMAIPHAGSGEIVDVRPLAAALSRAKTKTLVKTDAFEIIRLIVPAGKEIPTHAAPGEISVQCLEGQVEFVAAGNARQLSAGQLLYLSAAEPHSLKGIQDASLLVTLMLPKGEPRQPLDAVQEASEESFPASDSPAITTNNRS